MTNQKGRLLTDEEIRATHDYWNDLSDSGVARVRVVAKAQDTKSVKAMKDVLECAREAIVDAICCEDGLDGGAGKSVIDWITAILGDQEEFERNHSEDRE